HRFSSGCGLKNYASKGRQRLAYWRFEDSEVNVTDYMNHIAFSFSEKQDSCKLFYALNGCLCDL
ncbi:MAG: hypothetical protein JSU83_10440, partial [Deltaproteobacteria bacterium]